MGGDDWQPGDLALCVKTFERFRPTDKWLPKHGRIYRVTGIDFWTHRGNRMLAIEGDPDEVAWVHWYFRKLRPCGPQFARLLKRSTSLEAKEDAKAVAS